MKIPGKKSEWRGLLVFGLMIIGMGAGCASSPLRPPNLTPSPSPSQGEGGLSESDRTLVVPTSPFIDRTLWQNAWLSKPSAFAEPCATYRAGIIDHHTLASELMVHFIADLKRCRPDLTRFIILSPDHFRAATTASVLTHTSSYQTEDGTVSSDRPTIERLTASIPEVAIDPSSFLREHGVGLVVPFVRHLFPDTTVVPLIVSPRTSDAEAQKLATWLKGEMDGGAFVVVSSDMSHYLKEKIALANDEKTKKALTGGQRDFFWKATDDFTDNGRGIWLAQTALSLRTDGKATTWRLLDQDISSHCGGSSQNTTSYLTGFWW